MQITYFLGSLVASALGSSSLPLHDSQLLEGRSTKLGHENLALVQRHVQRQTAAPSEAIVWCSSAPASLIINGTAGGFLLYMGMLLLYAVVATRRNSQRLLDVDTKLADATLKATRVDCSGDETVYLCSYEFSASRADGVICRVEVTDRYVPEAAFQQMKEGSLMPVHYLPENPNHCRLTCVAEVESSTWPCFTVAMGISFVGSGLFCIVGIQCSLLPYGITSFVLGMLIGYGVCWCAGVFQADFHDTKLTELDKSGDKSELEKLVSAKT